MGKLRRKDGTVGISDLKAMASSPAHYRERVTSRFETTRNMRVGTGTHFSLFGATPGKKIVVFDGDRRQGKQWDAFAAEHADSEILTAPEFAEGDTIAQAVANDPIAKRLLDGARFEVPLKWEHDGFMCSTGGVDIVNPSLKCIADLKTTQSAEPGKFMRTAMNLAYPQQMAWYEDGCAENGIDTSGGTFIIAVESAPPHVVVVYLMSDAVLRFGRRSYSGWLEQLRVCEENDFWPGYTQSEVSFDLPEWAQDVDADDGDEEEVA